MGIRIGELTRQGADAVAAGRLESALRIYGRLVAAAPTAAELRLRLADVLAQVGAAEAAAQVYTAAAHHALRAGHPLVAVLIAKILEATEGDAGPLSAELCRLYSADSDRIARYGERLAPPADDTEVSPPDGQEETSLAQLVDSVTAVGTRPLDARHHPRMLHRIPLLSDLSAAPFRQVLGALIAHRLPDGAMVVREGEIGASFFFIATGAVRAYRTDLRGGETELGRLHEGALFGELALIHASPRTASVQVVGSCDLLEVPQEPLFALAAELDPVAAALERFCRERLLNNLLATAPLFRPFSRQQRQDLLKRFTGHQVAPGTVVLREGDPGRGLYLLLSGEVDVTKAGEQGQDVLLAHLKAGEVFGEIALLHGGAASATVTAARPSSLLYLDRVYFQRLIEAVPELRSYFQRLSEQRLANTRERMAEDLVIEDAAEDERWLI